MHHKETDVILNNRDDFVLTFLVSMWRGLYHILKCHTLFSDGSSFILLNRKIKFLSGNVDCFLKAEIIMILQSRMEYSVPLNLAFPIETLYTCA
jgi:hypothetical protein